MARVVAIKTLRPKCKACTRELARPTQYCPFCSDKTPWTPPDPEKRPTSELKVVGGHNRPEPVEITAPAPQQPPTIAGVRRPYVIADTACSTLAELAKALASHWTEAMTRISVSGDLEVWLQNDLNDATSAARYLAIVRQYAALGPSAKLSLIIATLDPSLPPIVDGEELTKQSLTNLARNAARSPALWPEVLRRNSSAFENFANLVQVNWLQKARKDWLDAQAQAKVLDGVLQAESPDLNAVDPTDDLDLLVLVLDEAERAKRLTKMHTLAARPQVQACSWIRPLLPPERLSAGGLWLLERRIDAVGDVSPKPEPPTKNPAFVAGIVALTILLLVGLLRQCGGGTPSSLPETPTQETRTATTDTLDQPTAPQTRKTVRATSLPPAAANQSQPNLQGQITPSVPVQAGQNEPTPSQAQPVPYTTAPDKPGWTYPSRPTEPAVPPAGPATPGSQPAREITDQQAKQINNLYRDALAAYHRSDCVTGNDKSEALLRTILSSFGAIPTTGNNAQSIQKMRANTELLAQQCTQSPAQAATTHEISDRQAAAINAFYRDTIDAYRRADCTAGNAKAEQLWQTVTAAFGTPTPSGKNSQSIQKMHTNVTELGRRCGQNSTDDQNRPPNPAVKNSTVNDWLNGH